MAKKFQLPVVGGLRKVIAIPDQQVGTTIAEFGSGKITLSQLKAALGVSNVPIPPNTIGGGGGAGAGAAIALGPGLSGGGAVVGAVPISLTAPIPAFVFDDGGGDGDPGPPGMAGAAGPQGVVGPTGPSGGPVGPAGPATYMSAEDGEDGWHAIPGNPGPAGAAGGAGAPGVAGAPGAALFFLAEDGAEGDPGPPGAAGAAGTGTTVALPGTIKDLFYWFKADPILANTGYALPLLQNYCPWLTQDGAVVVGTGTGATVTASGLNSQSVITFAASANGRYLLPQGSILTTSTIFAVFKPGSLAAAQPFLSGLTNSLEFNIDTTGVLQLTKTFVAVIGSSTGVVAVGTWYQANVTYTASTGAFAFRLARAASGSGTSVNTITVATAAVGYNQQSASQDITASLAELIVFNRVLTGAEITNVENYLLAKWGV